MTACFPMDGDFPSYLISHVTAPFEGLVAGEIVALTEIDSNITKNFTQYLYTVPNTQNMKTSLFGIVINGGFETMLDGRRPSGQPNFTNYGYLSGETVPVIVLQPGMTVYISDECFAVPPVVGNFAFPLNGQSKLGVGVDKGVGNILNLRALYKKGYRIGGQNGGGFISGTIFRVEEMIPIPPSFELFYAPEIYTGEKIGVL